MKVLTPEEVAELGQESLRSAREIAKLQKEIARLRGLIEGMGHEKDCAVRHSDFDECNCVKSQVDL